MNIQWYPGHMAKTRRIIGETMPLVDAVCEIVDARIPASSRIPDLDDFTGGRPRLIVLNRADQADADVTKQWADWYKNTGIAVVLADSKKGDGVKNFVPAVKALMKDKMDAYALKGQNRSLRVMVAGVPNVGKSSFINRVTGKKVVKSEDRPGVTRGKQWIHVDKDLELLDTPGMLWPKIDAEKTGQYLAFTGAIKDEIMDLEELASLLMETLAERYPNLLAIRYKIVPEQGQKGYALLESAAGKRGFLVSGGACDTERMARVLLDEFRGGKLGRITLERPGDVRG